MFEAIFIALVQAAAGDPAAAATDTSPAVETAQAEQAAAEPARELTRQERRRSRTCRKEQVTGSRFPQLVCTSEQQEERIDRETREFVRDITRVGLGPDIQ